MADSNAMRKKIIALLYQNMDKAEADDALNLIDDFAKASVIESKNIAKLFDGFTMCLECRDMGGWCSINRKCKRKEG